LCDRLDFHNVRHAAESARHGLLVPLPGLSSLTCGSGTGPIPAVRAGGIVNRISGGATDTAAAGLA
jgi:hypothetical protein